MSDGFELLQRKLQSLTQDQFLAVNRKALQEAGQVIQDAIIDRAPERTDDAPSGTALPPGAIKRAIRKRVRLAKDATQSSRVTVGPVGDEVRHVAVWVETGHDLVKGGYSKKDGDGRRGPGKVIGHVGAHPFVRPAADAVETLAAAVYGSTLREEIAKVMDA